MTIRKARTAVGDYTNGSEYVRDLIRRDQERSEQIRRLRTAIREGLDSGVSGKTAPQIMQEVEARLRADGRL